MCKNEGRQGDKDKEYPKLTLLLLLMATMMPSITIVASLPFLSEAHKCVGILFFIDPLPEKIFPGKSILVL